MSLFDDAKLILTPNGYKSGKAYSLKPFDGTGDFGVVRATTATRVNSAGLIESVAANVPRINYPIGGGCPHWLVEPQRTNLLLRSEEFNSSPWTLLAGATITPNTSIAPDGTTNADELNSDGTSNLAQVRQTITVTNGVTYNLSCFVKKGTNDFFTIRGISGTSDSRIRFNLNQLTFVTSGSPINVIFEDYDNGWYRISFSMIMDGTSLLYVAHPNNSVTAELGNQIIWGAQVVEGTEPSSYIPTVATAITRNADVITVAPPAGTTEIVEYFADNTTNTITVIPVTYQLPNAEIEKVIMT
jgi:hypothetical protein